MPDVYASIETAEQAMLADHRGAGARSLPGAPPRGEFFGHIAYASLIARRP
jgi:hypothetical protein